MEIFLCGSLCQQFFLKSSKLQLEWFRGKHHNRFPHEILGACINEPNAIICTNCDTDLKPEEHKMGRYFHDAMGLVQ